MRFGLVGFFGVVLDADKTGAVWVAIIAMSEEGIPQGLKPKFIAGVETQG